MVPKPSKLSFSGTQVKLNLYTKPWEIKTCNAQGSWLCSRYNLSDLGWSRASRGLHLHFSDEGKIQGAHVRALCSLIS